MNCFKMYKICVPWFCKCYKWFAILLSSYKTFSFPEAHYPTPGGEIPHHIHFLKRRGCVSSKALRCPLANWPQNRCQCSSDLRWGSATLQLRFTSSTPASNIKPCWSFISAEKRLMGQLTLLIVIWQLGCPSNDVGVFEGNARRGSTWMISDVRIVRREPPSIWSACLYM